MIQALGIQSSRNIAMILAQSGTATYSLSSVQEGIYAIGKAHKLCAPPRLSEVYPTLPLKRFQCSSDRPFQEDRLALPLSTPLSFRRSVV